MGRNSEIDRGLTERSDRTLAAHRRRAGGRGILRNFNERREFASDILRTELGDFSEEEADILAETIEPRRGNQGGLGEQLTLGMERIRQRRDEMDVNMDELSEERQRNATTRGATRINRARLTRILAAGR